ncbi:MAG: Ppx/GppA family phosphatase [Proteobacteria bacterium]|jgi:exopolyphosphatase/guanosine-5'-triphosphate,3'-diphosphate pyrophosphatase|nr:Ppx/GppA family phosphatase [Pseudomonadota bacterium]
MKVAALDLGTNTFLCLIADVENGVVTNVYHDTAEVVRLGQELNQTKVLHPEALLRSDATLKKFAEIIKRHKPHKILAMATSAARDAQNQSELFAICERYKIPVQIIPGEHEAQITFQGAVSNFPNDDVRRVVIDIGGGSTELIRGVGHKFEFGESIDIGAVRLTESFISIQPIEEVERRALKRHIDELITPVIEKIKQEKIDQLIAVAGTPTELAKMEIGKFDALKINGFKLKMAHLDRYEDVFASTSIEEKVEKLKVSPGRADIIFAGTTLLRAIVQKCGFEQVIVSTRGVRYGIALEMEKA